MNMIRNVRKLTRGRAGRRVPDARGGLPAWLWICIVGPVSASSHAADTVEWHPTGDIAAVAETFLTQRLGNSSGDTDVRVGMLDARLKLATCDQPLEAFLRRGTKIGPKTTVGVRCTGSKPWKIYLPVEVIVSRKVWVARHPLPRGHLLTADDLALDVRDVSRMTSSYVADQTSLIGQRLKSSILAGRVVTLQLIVADNVVRRGQTVTLAVSAGGLSIRVTGKALSDGALNQRIRVENLTSGRVVEGIVRSRELVEVLVPGTTIALTQAR